MLTVVKTRTGFRSFRHNGKDVGTVERIGGLWYAFTADGDRVSPIGEKTSTVAMYVLESHYVNGAIVTLDARGRHVYSDSHGRKWTVVYVSYNSRTNDVTNVTVARLNKNGGMRRNWAGYDLPVENMLDETRAFVRAAIANA